MCADVTATNKDGKIPLYFAIQSTNSEKVKLLLENGANEEFALKNGENYYVEQITDESNKMMRVFKWSGSSEKMPKGLEPFMELNEVQ